MDRDKEQIRAKFSRAAATYDEFARVQFLVAQKLVGLLPLHSGRPDILEIGCGTGRCSELIMDHFHQGARLSCLDFAPDMVTVARKRLAPYPVEFICGDGEEFLASCDQETYDLIISNGACQWFNDLPNSLAAMRRCLRPGGGLYFSIFGPGSLASLAQALTEVLGWQGSLPSSRFLAEEELSQELERTFSHWRLQPLYHRQSYADVWQLLRAIHATGTGGVGQEAPRLSRGKLAALDEWFSERGGVEVEYEVFLCQGRRGEGDD
ncbi:MAG: methyltransferase domain-containing protein [Thermodesulfobacteriota bacterium]